MQRKAFEKYFLRCFSYFICVFLQRQATRDAGQIAGDVLPFMCASIWLMFPAMHTLQSRMQEAREALCVCEREKGAYIHAYIHVCVRTHI